MENTTHPKPNEADSETSTTEEGTGDAVNTPQNPARGQQPEHEDPETEIGLLKKELQDKIDECQALNDKYLRLYAEFENFKRRAQREQMEAVRFGNEKLIKELLSTIDNLERAIQYGKDHPPQEGEGNGLLEGVELTLKHFLDILKKMGVSPITSVGETFDPSRHQAVAQVESSTSAANSVVEEFQKGYLLHDRILRPSMVTVASLPTDSTPKSNEQTGSQNNEGEEA